MVEFVIGYEIDAVYFILQEERFEKHTAQINMFLNEEEQNTKMEEFA